MPARHRAPTHAPPHQTRPTLRGTFGMAASTHWLASATAQSVLERGGNAFDAATAGAFVLHVAEPHLNGPGGDLVALLATATDPTPASWPGRAMPRAAPPSSTSAPRGSTTSPARAPWPPPFPAPSTPGSGCSPGSAPGNCVTSWPTRSTTPSAACPWCRSWRTSWPPSRTSSAPTGPPRTRCGCPRDASPDRTTRSSIPCTPARCAGWSPRAPARRARTGSRPRGAPGGPGSWRPPWKRPPRCPTGTPRAPTTPG